MVNPCTVIGGKQQPGAWLGATAAALLLLAATADAQTLRFSNHRRIGIPAYATLRIGPFYSTMTFSQSVGYRYTQSSGAGTDFLFDNKRGVIKTDGYEIPMVSSLDFRNYLLVSETMDVDMSVALSYSHFPLGTQDDAFNVNWAEKGIFINLDFDLLGLSTEFELTPFVKGTAYDRAYYRVDYVDTRGVTDPYGGSKYGHFNNVAGVNLDWLMAEDKNMAFSASREDNLPVDDKFQDQHLVAYAESVGYEQQLGVFVTAGVTASYGQNSYPDATNRPDSSSQSYSVHTTARLTQWSVAAASVGYSIGSTSGDGAGTEEGTMIGSASLKTTLTRNLSHSLAFSRSQRAGFNSPFEISDSYAYNLDWKATFMSAGLYSTFNTVDPQSMSVNPYSDWNSGVNVAFPIFVDVPVVCGDFITLLLSSHYDARDNGSLSTVESTDPEWQANYATWISRLGFSFPFIWSDITFATYVEHVDRTSEDSQLAYTRDIFEATFSFTHEF